MELLSSKEAAARLGVTQQTVSRLARENLIPSETVGKRRLFSASAVDAYLKANNLSTAPADHPRLTHNVPDVTAVSFFSGALGLDLGMERAGIAALLLCENDVKCRMTIDSNRPEAALLGDITKVDPATVYDYARIPRERGIDVMFGGPPCQAFSTAGARRAFNDARGNVFLKYLDLASDLRPRYLIIENVRGLLSTGYPLEEGGPVVHGGALRIILDRLAEMGYGVSFNLYNAANFGAPQVRERVVIIAKRDGSVMSWLAPTNAADPSWGLPAWNTLGPVLDRVWEERGKEGLHYSQFPEKRLKYFRMLGEGQYWRNLPESVQEEAMGKAWRLGGGKTGFYRRLWRDRPCATLVTSPTMPATDLCHPTELRPLAVEEYRAVQGFPNDWVIRGNLADCYRQIGNAVPVALGEAIGRAIVNDMRGETNAEAAARFRDFPFSRYKNTSQETWRLC